MPFRSTALFGFLASCLGLAGSLSPASAQPPAVDDLSRTRPLIVARIDEQTRSSLAGSVTPLAKSLVDMGPADASLRLEKMILLMKRAPEQQQVLDTFVAAQQNPKSPEYHKWLTPEQFDARFGAAPEDIAKITGWLSLHGFQVDPAPAGRRTIVFSGTNAQLQEAFGTSMHKVRQPGSSAPRYASLASPTIPSALAPALLGFARLNNIPLRPQHTDYGFVKRNANGSWALDTPPGKAVSSNTQSGVKPQFNITINSRTYHGVGPADFAAVYNLKPLWNSGIDGTGQSVAVVAKSDINLADTDAFRATFGLPAAQVEVRYAGPVPGFTASEGEASLDVQWSGAVAPKAKIYVVTSDDTATTDGLDLDFLYAIDNNLAPVLSVSWGGCEIQFGQTEQTYVSGLWQQAAAQGISVLVSSGDSGSATCDQNQAYATYGLQVNALASTVYDTAVGGTDLYGSYTDPARFWSSTNDPKTLGSALSYINELPWNESCANPQYLGALQTHGYGDIATNEQLCNDSRLTSRVLNTVGGGGGRSNCAFVASDGSCLRGHEKPAWQTGLPGMTTDGVRDVPDISFMAGGGLWGSFYVYCLSDATPSGTCNFLDNNDVRYLAAGGTSFSAPAFAGAVALLNQQTGTRQGLLNPTLYRLAASQYAAHSGSTDCDASAAADGPSCIFHDVTTGTIAEPCYVGSTDCQSPADPNASYGILRGFDAGVGYDLATGIGSANLARLVMQWPTAASTFLTANVSVTPTSSTFTYGAAAGGTIAVQAAGSASQPVGDVGILTDGYGNGPYTLSAGKANFSLLGVTPGTHSVTAHYAGDSVFGQADSTPVSVTITKAASTTASVSSRSSVLVGQSVTFTARVGAVGGGVSPTGTITFVDSTSGASLGTAALSAVKSSSPSAIAAITVSGPQLQDGANQIAVSYSGDGNYQASQATALSVQAVGAFTLKGPASLLVPADGSGSLGLTVTSNSGLLAAKLAFSCPANLPAGLTCSFTPAVVTGGSASAATTLTVSAVAKLLAHSDVSPANPFRSTVAVMLGGGLVAGLFFRRRRLRVVLLCLFAMQGAVLLSGCGNSSHQSSLTKLSVDAVNPAHGTAVNFTANVSALTGSQVPTGSVTFYENGTALSTGTLANGSAGFSTSGLTVGAHTISAVYAGDTVFLGSSSTAATTDVSFTFPLTVTASDTAGNVSTTRVVLTVQ